MKKSNRSWLVLSAICLFTLLGCNLGTAVAPENTVVVPTESLPTSSPVPTATLVINLPPQATNTSAVEITLPSPTPTSVPIDTPPGPTPTSGPVCIVVQDLNLRPGPGTAYRPPIIALPENSEIVPLGYNPVGVPGGSWVQVKDNALNQIGWVSAGSQFISCNIDLTGLPSVAVAPPPPPEAPKTNNSAPDGSFPPNLIWEADFNQQYFVRFRVYDNSSGGTKDGDGIAQVSFQVLNGEGKSVYERVEKTSGYCIFGGGEPDCNPWVLEDFIYKWGAGGEPVKDGVYQLLIVVAAKNGDQGNWNYEVNIDLP